MDEVVDGKVAAAVVEPTIINSSKQSRLNQVNLVNRWLYQLFYVCLTE